ncbi:MAG: excinuclease ABC subunit C [Bacteroidetes bacterium HGW-Bacteroidetes-21]|jgi:putative endonuclease|nr:MAG: excinuclease ABC subunit C [Bacteroidetes bacterium HGW-Bacteroidetes-21]
MEKGGSTYIISNKVNTVLYVGVTSNLKARIFEHKNKVYPNSFSARYNVDRLVYFENFDSIEEAIHREKQLKAGSRKKKEELIDRMNKERRDLYDELED